MLIALCLAASIVDASPFSTTGALIVANTAEQDRDRLLAQLLRWGMAMIVLAPWCLGDLRCARVVARLKCVGERRIIRADPKSRHQAAVLDDAIVQGALTRACGRERRWQEAGVRPMDLVPPNAFQPVLTTRAQRVAAGHQEVPARSMAMPHRSKLGPAVGHVSALRCSPRSAPPCRETVFEASTMERPGTVR